MKATGQLSETGITADQATVLTHQLAGKADENGFSHSCCLNIQQLSTFLIKGSKRQEWCCGTPIILRGEGKGEGLDSRVEMTHGRGGISPAPGALTLENAKCSVGPQARFTASPISDLLSRQ
jgi:hypothetical protein